MNRSARVSACLAAAAALVAGASVGVAAAHAAVSTERLTADVLPQLSSYTDLGRTDGAEHIQVDVTIARPNAAGEHALFSAMYAPGSPAFHKFLTPAQFDAQFGVAQSTFDAVRAFATAHGLAVASAPGSRDLLVLDGTVGQVEQTFGVALHDYRGDGKSFYANTTGPVVPAGLGISGVIGLTDKLGMHLFHNGPDSGLSSSATHGAQPAQDSCTVGTCTGLTTPQDLWSIYEQPGGSGANPIGNRAVDFGQGQRMAVFGEGQTDPVIANLRVFERLHGLPRIPVEVVHTDGSATTYDDNSGEVEWDLDTQASTGMAPDVTDEVLYFGHDLSDQSVLNSFNTWADDPSGPLQANASFGECEENALGDTVGSTAAAFSASAMFTLGSEAALEKATMEGRTLFSATGDTGSSCPIVPAATLNGLTNEAVPIDNYPASSPYVVGVGGTVVYGTDSTATTRSLEYSWTYTGGGTSFLFAKPDYQDGIANIAGVCTYSPGGGTANVGKPCIGKPDVAAQSGDVVSNGYGIVADGETAYPGGGTSLSSPLWMGMWTRIQASAPRVGRTFPGLGFANPTLYGQFKSADSANDFFDIGGGATSPPAGNGYYVSTPGWDYTSGMGTPRVANLSTDVNGTTTPTHPVLPKQVPVSAQRPTTCTPLFTDPAGDDAYLLGSNTGGNPQLDVRSAILSASHDRSTLRALLTVSDLSTAPAAVAPGVPGGAANEYYVLWTYQSTTYFANAEVDTTSGTVTYGDGTVTGSQYTTAHTDTGHFTPGVDGVVEIDVPVANIGSPAPHARFTGPGAQTKVLEGSSTTGGSIQSADSGGPQYDYNWAARCPALG